MRAVFTGRVAKGFVIKHYRADLGAVQHLERLGEAAQTLKAAGGAL